MDLTTVEEHLQAWYRLVASVSGDQSLEEQDEATDEVGYINLTRGCRLAQRSMIRMGFGGWRKRSSALVFTGSDAADGGRFVALPSDFLRAYGNQRRSALVEANGDRWGQQINEEDDHLKGDLYYIRGEELWVARTAKLPTTFFLDYHFKHPVWEANLDDGDIDFPLEARALIPAQAAYTAMHDNWLPGGRELESKIERAVKLAEKEARYIVRSTKQPRQFRKVQRFGNRW
jgi:hypothetical protein